MSTRPPRVMSRVLIVIAIVVAVFVPPAHVTPDTPRITLASVDVTPRPQIHPTPWGVSDGITWTTAVAWNTADLWIRTYNAAHQHHPRRPSGSRRRSRDPVECIGSTENGGDYGRSTNPNHFGRYQYDRQTWAANGGDPDHWGSASPDEQDRVFRDTLARYGTAPWRGDGCV